MKCIFIKYADGTGESFSFTEIVIFQDRKAISLDTKDGKIIAFLEGVKWYRIWEGEPEPENPSKPFIKVWPFYDAPKEYQELSTHGGDEDWIAYVPREIDEKYAVDWVYESAFGICDTFKHSLPNGDVVYIGAHS